MFVKLLSWLFVLSMGAAAVMFAGANGFSLQQINQSIKEVAQSAGELPDAVPDILGQSTKAVQLTPEDPSALSVVPPTPAENLAKIVEAAQKTELTRCSRTPGLPPHGICPTELTASGPIEVTSDNAIVENLDISSPDHEVCAIQVSHRKNVTIRNVNIHHAGAGICIFKSQNVKIDTVRVVNTIAVVGPHCKPGLTPDECKYAHRRKNPEKLYPVNTHNNIWVSKSKNIEIDTVYLERGETGVFTKKSSGVRINNFYCRDIRGPYWRGQCVQVADSDGAKLTRFYIQQFLDTSSGHDNINAFESVGVLVENGLIDGNWSRNGVGVIADTNAHDMTVRDVDIIHNGTAGVNVWSGPTKKDNGKVARNFTVERVRVKSGHCDVTWYNIPDYGPSSGGMAFAMHPAAEGARFSESLYWDHCRPHAVFSSSKPLLKDIRKQDFKLKDPPIDIQFPWM